jgi:DNA modification methylase
MQLNVKYRKVEDLIPYVNNSRKHSDEQVAQISASIKEFGWTNPILIDGTNSIIAGHGRLMAARKLKMDEVPTIELDHLTDTQRKALVIADNKLALNADWDNALLTIELDELLKDGFALDILGFNQDELAALLEPEQVEGLTDEDAVPDVPEEPKTKLGDIYQLGNHRLMCGDSTSIDAVDKLMNGEIADFCFTSPPYNLGDAVGLRNGARKGSDSAYNDFKDDGNWLDLMTGFIHCALIVSKVTCINVQMLAGNKIDLLHLFGKYSEKTVDIAIWSKSNPPPAMADNVMTSAFEFMWFITNEEKPKRSIKTASFERGRFSNIFTHSIASGHDASVHGAVFPLGVSEHFVKNCSKTNNIIIDFFGGTGTTLISCEKNNRRARMMELDPKYCDVIVKRWEDFTGKQAELLTND